MFEVLRKLTSVHVAHVHNNLGANDWQHARKKTTIITTNQQFLMSHPNKTYLNSMRMFEKPKNIFRLAPARGLGRVNEAIIAESQYGRNALTAQDKRRSTILNLKRGHTALINS